MGPTNDPVVSLPVSSQTLSKYLRVILSAGILALAGAADSELGVTDALVFSADTVAPVRLRSATGKHVMVANAAITAGAPVFAAASGKVAPTGQIAIGIALDAATADGDYIRVLRGGTSAAGVGYSAGTGGTVTQITSRATGVTLSKLCGTITTDPTSLAAGAEISFTVTNTLVAANDVVAVCVKSGGTTSGSTWVQVTAVADGSFQITLTNLHAATADTAALVINFVVIKSVAA